MHSVATYEAPTTGLLARTALDYTLTLRFTWRSVPGARSRLVQEPAAVGDGGGLAAAGHAELGQDVGDVDAGGPGADEQRLGDLGVRAAVGDQGEHLAFAGGQLVRVGRLCGRGLRGCRLGQVAIRARRASPSSSRRRGTAPSRTAV